MLLISDIPTPYSTMFVITQTFHRILYYSGQYLVHEDRSLIFNFTQFNVVTRLTSFERNPLRFLLS